MSSRAAQRTRQTVAIDTCFKTNEVIRTSRGRVVDWERLVVAADGVIHICIVVCAHQLTEANLLLRACQTTICIRVESLHAPLVLASGCPDEQQGLPTGGRTRRRDGGYTSDASDCFQMSGTDRPTHAQRSLPSSTASVLAPVDIPAGTHV